MSRTPVPDRVLAEAAALRAEGATWETIADHLGRKPSSLRSWPTNYGDRWAALLREAELRVATEAAAESVLALRAQLRSKDPEASRAAAARLIRYRIDVDRSAGLPPLGVGPPAHAELIRVAAHLETLTDDQREQLLDRAVAVVLGRRGARPAGGGPAGA